MSARILIIDDDAILAGLLQLTLQLEGYEVEIAGDGDAGLTMVRTQAFDLILLDLIMPKIDGVKFLRLLNEDEAPCPPVMIVSSAIEEKLTSHHSDLGVVDIARKPVEPAMLVTRVKRALADAALTVPASDDSAPTVKQNG